MRTPEEQEFIKNPDAPIPDVPEGFAPASTPPSEAPREDRRDFLISLRDDRSPELRERNKGRGIFPPELLEEVRAAFARHGFGGADVAPLGPKDEEVLKAIRVLHRSMVDDNRMIQALRDDLAAVKLSKAGATIEKEVAERYAFNLEKLKRLRAWERESAAKSVAALEHELAVVKAERDRLTGAS